MFIQRTVHIWDYRATLGFLNCEINISNDIVVSCNAYANALFGLVTTTFPGVGNPSVEVALDGVTVQTVSASCVTNSTAYDKYLRVVAETDGRGNVTARAYDARGRLASVTDAVGATTAYGYDEAGRVCAVTNALGNVTVYEYDVRGNKTYEGGAVYPVVYDYDLFGQKVGMTTFRDEASGEGDSTTWAYDEATGALLSKTYADGHGVAYTLTDLGQAATRTDARGNVTAYAYNVYGDLVSQTYSDGTPAVGYVYDVFGRQAQATDAVGTTTFGYNAYGELETESITGEYAKTLTHHFDAYGRDAGYSVNGSRRMTLGYDPATGRLATMNEGGAFAWAYLPGSDLKARLTYPNGLTAEWAYEPGRDLLTAVTNSLPDGTALSTYVYANDLLGRRVSKNDEQYGYDLRDQLTSADARSYAYDDIGNRTVAEGRAYAANALNQYTAIDAFEPEYDADGNQTKVLTETGEWAVEYNAENRPIRWTQGNKVITMGFDRMGRRVFYKEMEGNRQVTYTKFLYNGYLCVQQLFSNSPWNVYKEFIWDPTEPVATRPLCFRQNAKRATFLLHDGNKNVTDVVTVGPFNEPVAHYDYAPFGAVAATGSRAADNPFRFSSEFHDDALALVYYNYRHYNPNDGRWLGRDPLEEEFSRNLYLICGNSFYLYDILGLDVATLGGPNAMAESILYDPDRPAPPPVSGIEELIPVYGPIRGMDEAFYNGHYVQGAFNLGIAISDITLLRSVVSTLGKGCWKTGSHTWRATRRWYGKQYSIPPGTHVHHQFIRQNSAIGKHIPDWIKNQPWNLNPIYGQTIRGEMKTSSQVHSFIHGNSPRLTLTRYELWYLQYSTGAKAFQISTSLRVVEELVFEKDGEASETYLDCKRVD